MCPYCGKYDVTTYESRRGKMGFMRRRKCNDCGGRWGTTEVRTDEYKMLISMAEKVQEMAERKKANGF